MTLPLGELSADRAEIEPIGGATEDRDKSLPVGLALSEPQLVEGPSDLDE